MEATLNIFSNKEFGEIRIVMIDGEPWFVGKDVAKALGYADPSSAVSKNVDTEDKTTLLLEQDGSNYKSKTTIINESGLYALIFGSKLESAKRFKHWVTSEVLPSIRKTGSYTYNQSIHCNVQPKVVGSMTEIPQTGNWYDLMKPSIEGVCEVYSITRKQLYHLILTRVQSLYNWDYAVAAYINETGHAPRYPMEVVAHFQQLQEEANYVIETLIKESGNKWW